MKHKYFRSFYLVPLLFGITVTAWAALPAPPGGPGVAAGQMYTLVQIYARLTSGTSGVKMSTFAAPGSGPSSGGNSLDQIMAAAPANDSANGAVASDVTLGKTFWGLLTSGGWGIKTGTRSSILAPVTKTGQTTSYAANDDGAKQTGATTAPRFTDNANGSVKDNLTGLVWLKNANCYSTQTWTNALTSASGLASGSCGLTDGSTVGQWRLPNVNELESMVSLGNQNPSLPTGHPFTSVVSSHYWSSSTYLPSTTGAWSVYFSDGYVYNTSKTLAYYVWPVR